MWILPLASCKVDDWRGMECVLVIMGEISVNLPDYFLPREQSSHWPPSASHQGPWCSCVWVRLQPVCLVVAWYGFAAAPRRTSSGHAVHVTGGPGGLACLEI
jgi:hypothetical protein